MRRLLERGAYFNVDIQRCDAYLSPSAYQRKYGMWSSNPFSASSCFPRFPSPGFSGSRFFRLQVFQGQGFLETRFFWVQVFFRVQVFQDSGFLESRCFRVQIFQGQGFFWGPVFFRFRFFLESRLFKLQFFRVQVFQGLGPGFRNSRQHY